VVQVEVPLNPVHVPITVAPATGACVVS